MIHALALRMVWQYLRDKEFPLFRHRKRVSREPYVKIGVAQAQCSTYDIQEGDNVAVYLSSSGILYVRHDDEFTDGRFYEVHE